MGRASSRQGTLFVISGPSGVGKGTIVKRVLKESDAELSVSMTTREPREGEQHGRDYYFVTTDEFKESIANGKLLEYAVVFENMYGTPREAVARRLEKGRDVILEIDVQGGLKVKSSMPEAVLIFILPPSLRELRERIEGRATDAPDVIDRRMNGALNEIKLVGEYDYYIVNDDLETAVSTVREIMAAEEHRVPERVMPLIRQYEEEKNQDI